MTNQAVSASTAGDRWASTALALAATLCLGVAGCDTPEPTRPARDADVRPLPSQVGTQVASTNRAPRGKAGRHVMTARRSVPAFVETGTTLSGAAANAEIKRRLRAAIASGETRGWKQRMRASNGSEVEVGARELLELFARFDHTAESTIESASGALFRPAAFQSDTGVLSIAGLSIAPAHSTGFDFYTTSIASTTNREKKWMESVWHDGTRTIWVPNGPTIYHRESQDEGKVNGDANYDIFTTIWGGVSGANGCAYDSAITAQHKLTGRRWATGHVMQQYVFANTGSLGSDQLRRPCHEKPVSLCDDPATCDLDGDGRSDDSPRSVGGEVEWNVSPPATPNGSKVVCMVTDWYDEYGNYLDTSVDYCWIE